MVHESSRVQPFGAELRRRREEKGLSQSKLAAMINYSKSHLSKVESAIKSPTVEFARLCDRELEANGELSRLVPAPGAAHATHDGDDEGDDWAMYLRNDGSGHFQAVSRRGLITSGAAAVISWPAATVVEDDPAPVSGHSLTAYWRLLDDLRRLGQSSRSGVVLQIAVATTNALRTQSAVASAPDRPALQLLAARFAEYTGWMAQELGDDAASAWWTRNAVALAAAAGDPDMTGYALVRSAEIALYREDPLGVLHEAQAALKHSAQPRVQAFAQQRLAQGHALLGDEAACMAALDAANEWIRRSHDRTEANPLGSVTMRDPLAFTRAWCLLDLGKPKPAAEVLEQEFAEVPAHAHRVRARYGARLALALATQKQLDHACDVAIHAVESARVVDSATIRADLRRLARTLRRWHFEPVVRRIVPGLTSALHLG